MQVGSDAAPAGGRRTLLPLPGGAGAPPGGTMTPCEELADGGQGLPEARKARSPERDRRLRAGGRAKRRVRKRGPAPYGRRAIPSIFLRGTKETTAYPAPPRIRAMTRACTTNPLVPAQAGTQTAGCPLARGRAD